MRPSPPALALRQAYAATDYLVESEPPVTLRVDAPPGAFDAWLTKVGYRSATLITAWNPFSVPLADTVNRERNTALVQLIEDAGYRSCHARSRSRSGNWPDEEGFCVFEANGEWVDDWMRAFEQYAVLTVCVGGPCRLVWHPFVRE